MAVFNLFLPQNNKKSYTFCFVLVIKSGNKIIPVRFLLAALFRMENVNPKQVANGLSKRNFTVSFCFFVKALHIFMIVLLVMFMMNNKQRS